ncbi:amphoterin-induced protein 2-like [Oppia nitens]|uniref:amphoterin-induced protein 2-like n=1 Tax=Oppia nitens TaxID=1686743 RepID=UPI0023DBC2E7|nr:amphoterin-induced protein 2-like [Oppia nitens]
MWWTTTTLQTNNRYSDHFLALVFVIYLVVGQLTAAENQWKETTGCPEAFKGRCQCGLRPYGPTGRMSYVTNCTNTNFTTTDILTQMSPQTEVLIFTGNRLQSLPQNLIGQDVTYEKLHTIDLSNNSIQFIRGKSFHNVKTVRVLNLNDNEIIIDEDNFHPRMFSNFLSLEELHLRNAFDNSVHDLDFLDHLWITFNESQLNTLKVLDLNENHIRMSFPSPDMFCALPALQRLHLANNYLTDFTLNLTCLKDLNSVDVSYNFITKLTNRSIALIETGPANYHINVSMNSFRCDCELIDFFLWSKMPDKDIRLDSAEKYRCVYGHPMDNAGRYFDDLSVMDLECFNSVKNDDFRDYISFSYTILTVLVIILAALLTALVYINRDFLSHSWTYLRTGVIAKREYTALEKESKRHNHLNQEVAEVEV